MVFYLSRHISFQWAPPKSIAKSKLEALASGLAEVSFIFVFFLFSIEVVFNCSRLPLWSSSIEAVFHSALFQVSVVSRGGEGVGSVNFENKANLSQT